MTHKTQVFQTASKLRWRTFQWSSRLIIFLCIISVPVVALTIILGRKPLLPVLINDEEKVQKLLHPITPQQLKPGELKKYKGIPVFLQAKEKNESLIKQSGAIKASAIRAAFYVDWSPQSFYSLQKNISKLNMVVPEWFFIDPKTDTLIPKIDKEALDLMQHNAVSIVPILNNVSDDGSGDFDGNIVKAILHNKAKRERLINDVIKYLTLYKLQGVNIDFEELKEKSDEPIIMFQQELYNKLHSRGFIVTQDIMPANEDFNVKELSQYNDYMFLMAYDEHYSTSVPGPICSQQWIEKVLDETAKEVSSNKIILCLAGYGYDWAQQAAATTLTYQQSLVAALQYGSVINFNNSSYNNEYNYKDAAGKQHSVYFTDAATIFNIMRFADEYGTAGTALWRLGSEDDRMWQFYDRSLSNESMIHFPFNFSLLENVNTPTERPDYIGDGEILDVITTPKPGKINIEIDSTENIISEQNYIQLPTKYVIKKFGKVHNQVILTFDDGPDPEYTPAILDILKKEKIRATFFVVGMMAEDNLPLLRRIYNEGHEIGNHTFTHPNIAAVSDDRALTEMESTRLLIEAITGRSTIMFRAPFNADAEPTKEVELKPIALSKLKNYYSIGESIDPNDWEPGVSADSVYERTIRQYEANPEKGIILLHDSGGDRAATVQALPRIIEYFKSKGVGFTTVAQLVGKHKDDVMPIAHGNLMSIDNTIFTTGYWMEKFMESAFWIAIILGAFRIIAMTVMAFLQKIRSQRNTKINGNINIKQYPFVSIIVPAFNEEINAVKTVQNLLLQDYPYFEIVFIDDGSKDSTYQRVQEAFATNNRVKVFTKPNGGKASALNYGIQHTSSAYLVCIDADTQLKQDAISHLMKIFLFQKKNEKEIGAVAGNVKVGNERNMITMWQSIEYITAQNFDRRAFDLINAITVVPGAIGAFTRKAILDAGLFTTDTLAEDCDLTIRILKEGYRIENCTEAIAVTEAPETLKQFMKQRFRWSYGIMQSFWKNRDACFNPKFKILGMVALPNILIFQIVLPMLAPLADLMFLVSIIWNRKDPVSIHKIELYYLLFFLVDILVSIIAFSFEKEKYVKLLWLIPQRLVYRQLMYVILFKSIRKAIKGESQGWGALKRTGSVKDVVTS